MAKIRAITISDMHLLRDKGDFKGAKGDLLKLISGYDKIYWNGDIFELFFGRYFKKEKESLKHAQDKACRKALNRLEKIILSTPESQHEYILGNHEDVPAFKEGLNKLAEKHPNFRWHEKLLAEHDLIFLHGDLPYRGNDTTEPREVYPVPARGLKPANHLKMNQVYNWAFTMGEKTGMDALRFIRSPKNVAGKNLEYLREHYPDELKKVKFVFSGHTHNHFKHELDGIVFYNTGTQTMDAERNFPLELEIDTETGQTIVKELNSFQLRLLAEQAPKWIVKQQSR